MMIKIVSKIVLFLALIACNQKKTGVETLKSYNTDGTIKSSIQVIDNMRNGLSIEYDHRGRLKSKVEYRNNMKNGSFEEFIPETGVLILKAKFVNDTQQVPLLQFYREGMLYRESNYEKGRLNGPHKTYWPNGNKREVVYFEMGKQLIQSEEFDKNGIQKTDYPKIIVEKSVVKGKSVDVITFKMSLSDRKIDAEFYITEPDVEKYLPTKKTRLPIIDGVASKIIYQPKSAQTIEKFGILVKYKTEYNNFKYIYRSRV